MYLRLNDVFPDWLTGDGIFYYLQSQDLIPWKDANIADILDTAYHGDHGDRLISPLVRKLLNTDNELTTANKQKLASVIYNLFIDQWSHEWNLLLQEYNPISNYDMVETETPAEITHTITPAETSIDTLPAKTITENEVSGFDSSSYVDGSKITVTGDIDNKGSEQLTVDSAGSDVLTVQNERTLTRSGNIGVTTTQQMMQSEIELWKWNFYRSVFKDIDSVLTLKIY